MNKNNKKTMNERTHNPFDVYKEDKNSNSNNSTFNDNQEFSAEFGANASKQKQNRK